MKKEEIGTLAGIVWRALNEKGSLSFEDLQRETPLWRLDDVPEEVRKYPEFSMFGELPAWGFYVRHVNRITFHCVHLSLRDSDFRPAFVFDDVRQLTMEQVTPDESVFN